MFYRLLVLFASSTLVFSCSAAFAEGTWRIDKVAGTATNDFLSGPLQSFVIACGKDKRVNYSIKTSGKPPSALFWGEEEFLNFGIGKDGEMNKGAASKFTQLFFKLEKEYRDARAAGSGDGAPELREEFATQLGANAPINLLGFTSAVREVKASCTSASASTSTAAAAGASAGDSDAGNDGGVDLRSERVDAVAMFGFIAHGQASYGTPQQLNNIAQTVFCDQLNKGNEFDRHDAIQKITGEIKRASRETSGIWRDIHVSYSLHSYDFGRHGFPVALGRFPWQNAQTMFFLSSPINPNRFCWQPARLAAAGIPAQVAFEPVNQIPQFVSVDESQARAMLGGNARPQLKIDFDFKIKGAGNNPLLDPKLMIFGEMLNKKAYIADAAGNKIMDVP